MSQHRPAWSPEQVRALGVATNIDNAASVLNISRGYAYRLLRENRFPVGVVQIGERTVVPVAGLIALLGIDDIPEATDEVAA